jgi:hypothetical protein
MARTWIGLAALLLGVLAGCTSGPVGSASSGSALSSSTAPGGVEPTGAPAPEGPPQAPVPPQAPESRPTVYLPTAPAGAGSESTEGGGGRHCVSLVYLDKGHPIPDGVESVWSRPQLTDVAATYFDPGTFSCMKGPLCDGFVWTAANQEDGECWVPVQEKGTWPDEYAEAQLATSGSLVCPVGKRAVCDEFKPRIRIDNDTVSVTVESDGTAVATTTTAVPPTEQATSEPTAEPTEAPATN